MLIIESRTVTSAYVETLKRLFLETKKYDDPEILREDAAAIHIQRPNQLKRSIDLRGGIMQETFPYEKFFPHVKLKTVQKEMAYWNQQFFASGKLTELVDYLREFPLTKRGIILFWNDRFRDLSKGAVCEIAAFFRIKNKRVDMHTHMRANNASFLLFMDMRILTFIQAFVAQELGLQTGEYLHFIDSLHIYENESAIAKGQLQLCLHSDEWKNLHIKDI